MIVLSLALLLIILFSVAAVFVDIEAFPLTLVGLVFLVLPITIHNSDLVDRDSAHLVIQEYSSLVEELKVQMGDLPELGGALMNADTPYASISKQLTTAKSALRDAKLAKVETVKDIEKRRRGLFQWVTWFDGE